MIGVQQYVVKPTVADINENVLSEQLVSESSLTEELVKSSGVPLQTAIQKVSSTQIYRNILDNGHGIEHGKLACSSAYKVHLDKIYASTNNCLMKVLKFGKFLDINGLFIPVFSWFQLIFSLLSWIETPLWVFLKYSLLFLKWEGVLGGGRKDPNNLSQTPPWYKEKNSKSCFPPSLSRWTIQLFKISDHYSQESSVSQARVANGSPCYPHTRLSVTLYQLFVVRFSRKCKLPSTES